MSVKTTEREQASPTLIQGQRYLSIVAPVPAPLCHRIYRWQVEHQAPNPREKCHITVFIVKDEAQDETLGRLVAELKSVDPIEIELGEPSSFWPQTPVAYLRLHRGISALQRLHDVVEKILGPSASPFRYVPHLTLAHQMPQELLADAVESFADIPQALCNFTVGQVELHEFDGERWALVQNIPLGGAKE